jgi:hypothetical protein
MRAIARICIGLAVFLLVAGTVYVLTAKEYAGATMFLIASATFWFIAFVTRSIARGEGQEEEAGGDEEIHVAPTIWPFGFAISGVLLLLGFIVSQWILLLGAAAFVVSAVGWFRDIARSRVSEH